MIRRRLTYEEEEKHKSRSNQKYQKLKNNLKSKPMLIKAPINSNQLKNI